MSKIFLDVYKLNKLSDKKKLFLNVIAFVLDTVSVSLSLSSISCKCKFLNFYSVHKQFKVLINNQLIILIFNTHIRNNNSAVLYCGRLEVVDFGKYNSLRQSIVKPYGAKELLVVPNECN